TGYRIFWNPLLINRCEKARNKVAVSSGSRSDRGKSIGSCKPRPIRGQRAHLIFTLENAEIIAGAQEQHGLCAARRYQTRSNRALVRWPRWKIKHIPFIFMLDCQLAALRLEAQPRS